VPVEPLLEPGLVEEVADETDAPAQHEQTVQESVLQVVLSLRAIITLAVDIVWRPQHTTHTHDTRWMQ
jgi:hypothetical protein